MPYLLLAVLYLSLAVLAALESSFSSLKIVPWFNGMVWLRVHLITLGVLAQILFGILPAIAAIRHRLPKPNMRWDIWLILNAGIMTLIVGIPLINKVPIFIGGTLVFIATVLLISQLAGMKKTGQPKNADQVSLVGRKFYIAGLAYFLLGIIIGTGLWIGWMEPLGVVGNAKEVHIHANIWGLMSLVFAGLLVDMYEQWVKRPFPNPNAITPIFWLMTVGAFGLIFGPWFANNLLLIPGLILHIGGIIWLLINVIQPLRGDKATWTPAVCHLVVSYFWIIAPVLMAPIVLSGVFNVTTATIEATAPQSLIYGWLLQFGYAVIPYFFTRIFLPDKKAKLGGTWFSFASMNLGVIFLWTSIFITPLRGVLYGIAYLLWAISILPIVINLWQIMQAGFAKIEHNTI
ncbi:MAG: hypothetical protein GY943_08150 [Chloroflexi bacterium]|nr:hypothetical protein [Chloroflexota bacterium]